jgi:hypothetical protein
MKERRKLPTGEWIWQEVEPWPRPAAPTVYAADEPEWSGLYDAQGHKLIRERRPFGFRR